MRWVLIFCVLFAGCGYESYYPTGALDSGALPDPDTDQEICSEATNAEPVALGITNFRDTSVDLYTVSTNTCEELFDSRLPGGGLRGNYDTSSNIVWVVRETNSNVLIRRIVLFGESGEVHVSVQ